MSLDSKKDTLNYFSGDALAANVWSDKYQYDGEKTPDNMHLRMAKEFARIDAIYQIEELEKSVDGELNLSDYGLNRKDLTVKEIYTLFKGFKTILPQGSVMSQLGNEKQIGSLSNCFVIGQPEDSYGGIMLKDQELVQLMKRRGGVGIDISTLRPNDTPTSNAAKTSTGSVSFMERFSNSTREVAQNGRRGALMLSIDVRHPDVADFISIKSDRSKVTGANISVSLRDDFMEAVKKDDDYILQYPVDADVRFQSPVEKYNVLEKRGEWVGKNGEKVDIWLKKVRAKELYALIIKNAWENAEPGQIFIDRHWNYSPDGVYPQYRGITTNPCVVGDTMIKTDKGELKISEIVDRFNDGEIFKALSYNENTKAMEYKPIFNAQKTEEDATILEIETENGNKIRLTPNHKVYTEEDGWIESSKLTINHTILEIID